jgi:hypothetical protein
MPFKNRTNNRKNEDLLVYSKIINKQKSLIHNTVKNVFPILKKIKDERLEKNNSRLFA